MIDDNLLSTCDNLLSLMYYLTVSITTFLCGVLDVIKFLEQKLY